MSELKIPKLEGSNLETYVGLNGMGLNDPENRKKAWIETDKPVLNIEDMR